MVYSTRNKEQIFMEKQLRPIKRPPLIHHAVQEAIRAYILENNLQPDDMLPGENDLAQQLNVSRSSVREAIKGLESLGLLEARRGSGVFVREFSFDPILDNLQYGLVFDLKALAELLEIRRVLETGMVGQAMSKMTDERLKDLDKILEQMGRRAEVEEAFPDEDRAFHQVLFADIDNQTLLKLLDIFWLVMRRVSEQNPNLWDNNPKWTYQLHTKIVEALRDADAERVREALFNHYSGLESRLAQHFNGSLGA
jgi:DNA-binding FadR family transcriptional regulator